MAVLLLGALWLWKRFWPDTKPATLAWMALFLVVLFALRLTRFEYISHDYIFFLGRWVGHFRDNGGFLGLRTYPGDYNAPYLYFLAFFSYLPFNDLFLIKMASTVFDLAMAFGMVWAVMGMAFPPVEPNRPALSPAAPYSPPARPGLDEQTRGLLFCLVLALPTVWFNSADWGQCDSIYAAFAILSLGSLVRKRSGMAVIFAAIALSFKLQAIFFLPLGIICLLTKRIKWRDLVWFPVTYFAMILPAILFGKPFLPTLLTYFNQTQSHSLTRLNLNAPAMFAFFPNDFPIETGRLLGILLAGAFVAGLTAWLWWKRGKLDDAKLFAAAAAFCIFVPFLLPGMHDRYFFMADVITVGLIFVVIQHTECRMQQCAAILAPVFVQLGSYTAYHVYLSFYHPARRPWLFGDVSWLPWDFRYSMAPGALFMLLGGLCVLWMLFLPSHKQRPEQSREHPANG
jgi:Gpi18-like mannosyltransferase